jgi:hypothetical protein
MCVVLVASMAFAQGQRGGYGGGFGGGDNGGFGGRGRRGGGGGGNRSFSPDDMLKRLDTNGNGMLDEEEVANSPARAMIEGILGRMGIPAKYPIPISDISNAMQAMRQARANNGPPGGGRGQRPPQNVQPNSAVVNNSPSGSFNNSPITTLPTSPTGPGGFGEPTAPLPAPLGFGEGGAVASSAVSGTSGDPALDQKIRALADAIVKKYDKNGDSHLDSSEWPTQSKWGTFSEANRSGGASIGVTELAAYLTDLSRRQQLSFDLPDAGSPGTPDSAKPKPKRFLTPKERLPSGLPDWFLQAADEDGQVTMAECSASFGPEEAVAKFARYDLNQDGIITAAECLKVEKQQAPPR